MLIVPHVPQACPSTLQIPIIISTLQIPIIKNQYFFLYFLNN